MISFFTSAYSLLRLAALRLAVSCGLISAANAVVVGPLLASQRTRGESVSREEKVAVVEAYLRGLAGKDISKIPFAANITFEGPRVGKLIGRNAVVGFLTSILPAVRSVQIKQHIVEGDFVATVFEMGIFHHLNEKLRQRAGPTSGWPTRPKSSELSPDERRKSELAHVLVFLAFVSSVMAGLPQRTEKRSRSAYREPKIQRCDSR